MKNTDVISRIVRAFFEDLHPKGLERELKIWLAGDTHAEEKREAMRALWERIPMSVDRSVYRSLRVVNFRLGLARSKARRSPRRPLLRVAAVVLPLLLLAGGWYLYYQAGKAGPMAQLAVENGKHGHITLSDGTEIWLNGGSVIYYPEYFGRRERRVRLEGEGYFSVTKNRRRPFVVEVADSLAVRVLGTDFNVRAYPDQEAVAVTLHNGAVSVDAHGGQTLMEPRHQLAYNLITKKADMVRLEREIDDLSSWRSGKLIFHCSTASEILHSLERHFAVSIDFDREIFKNDQYYMHFEKGESLENILGILSGTTCGFDYCRSGDRVTISESTNSDS